MDKSLIQLESNERDVKIIINLKSRIVTIKILGHGWVVMDDSPDRYAPLGLLSCVGSTLQDMEKHNLEAKTPEGCPVCIEFIPKKK